MSERMGDNDLEFAVNDEWAAWHKENSWAAFVPEFAEDSDGQEYMRPLGRQVIYKVTSDDGKGNQTYACNTCGSEILGATKAHSIWDGPFPCSGSGRCHYESVPYCPKCEEEPNSSGTPISIGPKIR